MVNLSAFYLAYKESPSFWGWEKLGGFDGARRAGPQLASCIDLDEVMDGIHAYEVCNLE